MDKIKIEKNTVQETLIIPLYARKLCTEEFPQLFRDEAAVRLIERLDYDFSMIEKQSGGLMYRFGALEVAMRQKDLSSEVQEYLQQHPKAAVVNLGCGLDQTGRNCDNGSCRIYNIDLPDVIDIRNELLPAGEREKNIGIDLHEKSWFEKIDASGGAIFFAAGVFYYFRKTAVKQLITAMAERFPGGRLVFDSCGKFGLKMLLRTWIKDSRIKDVGAYFYIDDLRKDLGDLPDRIRSSSRGYMLGYFSLEDPKIPRIHRLLAKIADGPIRMKIVRLEFEG